MNTISLAPAAYASTPPAERPAAVMPVKMPVKMRVTIDGAMPTSEELEQWAKSVGACGDRAAFASLFEHFAPRVKAYLIRSGSSDSAAEELVQETMVLVWRKAAQFDARRAAVSTWIFTIARNLRVDAHRRRGGLINEGEAQDGHDIPDPAATLDEHMNTMQRELGVRAAMAKLPADQARVLRLSFFEEHPHARISKDLGIPLGTVKSRIRLAMVSLRRLLDGMES